MARTVVLEDDDLAERVAARERAVEGVTHSGAHQHGGRGSVIRTIVRLRITVGDKRTVQENEPRMLDTAGEGIAHKADHKCSTRQRAHALPMGGAILVSNYQILSLF